MLPVFICLFVTIIVNISILPQQGIVTGFRDLSTEVHQPCSALAYLLEDGTYGKPSVLVSRPFLKMLICINKIRGQCKVNLILDEVISKCSEVWGNGIIYHRISKRMHF